jgi:hypothetical protein
VVRYPYRPGPFRSSGMLLEPRRQLLVRHEVEPHRVYADRKTLWAWLAAQGINREMFFAELRNKGILGNFHRHATLGAGTKYRAQQVVCVEFVTDHPEMEPYLRTIERVIEPSKAKEHEQV